MKICFSKHAVHIKISQQFTEFFRVCYILSGAQNSQNIREVTVDPS